MAKHIVRRVICDFTHDDDQDHQAVETIRFSVGRQPYELDVCAEHADEVQDELAAWVAVARKAR